MRATLQAARVQTALAVTLPLQTVRVQAASAVTLPLEMICRSDPLGHHRLYRYIFLCSDLQSIVHAFYFSVGKL